jgi:hypothetical protein
MEQKTKLEQKHLEIHLQGVFLLPITNSHFRASPPYPLLNRFQLASVQHFPRFGYTSFSFIYDL